MILSSEFVHAWPLWVGLFALLGYGVAALPVAAAARANAPEAAPPRWPSLALGVGWVMHALALLLHVGAFGAAQVGVRFGFAPVLSLTVWLVIAVHAVESRFVPLPAVRRALAAAGGFSALLALLYPGEVPTHTGSPWLPLHWMLGVVSYGLFGVALLHAWLLGSAERRLRLKALRDGAGPLGLPLLRLERLTFRFVEAGFVVLSAALLFGVVFASPWRWDHKTVLSLLGWGTFAVLVVGRHWRGWRGKHAVRWLYAGALLLLLAYVGSRFVFEVLLRRGAVA